MKLLGIAIKGAKKVAMSILNSARVSQEAGVVGDYRGSLSTKRQVTLLSKEQWSEACKEISVIVPWEARRSNLLIEGHRFCSTDVGKLISIGKDVVLEITGETAPCSRMDETKNGLKSALEVEWRGGVTARVLMGGEIEVGDEVMIKS